MPTGPDGGAKCTVSISTTAYDTPDFAATAQIFPNAQDLVVNYCNLYSGRSERGTDLVLDHTVNEIEALPPDGTALLRTPRQITFTNGAYAYTVYYGENSGNPRASNDARRGLRAIKGSSESRPVFQKKCLPKTTYDGLFSVEMR